MAQTIATCHTFKPKTIVTLFASSCKAEAIDGANSHSRRRQFVTTLADQGVNPRVIQLLVRHRSLQTTMIYIEAGEAKLRKAVEMIKIMV
jgi:integrase/recombinase XerD